MRVLSHPKVASGGRFLVAVVVMALVASVVAVPVTALGQDEDPYLVEVRAEIDTWLDEMQALLDSGEFDHLDPAAIAAAVGAEPAALRDWVASNTEWVPYSGSLRGVQGMLADGSGNSLDRALLLAALLTEAGHQPLLAHAALSEADAQALVDEAAATDSPTGATEAEDVAYVERARVAADALVERVGAPEAAAGLDPVAAATDHWWVQLEGVDGAVDLDPTLDQPPAAEATWPATELPQELRHTVTTRVVIERIEEDGLARETVLEHTEPLGGETGLRSAELRFIPVGADDAEEVVSATDVAIVSTHWQPALRIEDDYVYGDWFSRAGVVEEPTEQATSRAFDAGASALGGLGAGEAEEPSSTQLGSVWLEFETQGPGSEPRLERRALVDVVGDAARAEGAAAMPSDEEILWRDMAVPGITSILFAGGMVSPERMLRDELRYRIASRNAYIAAALAVEGIEDERISGALEQGPLHHLDLLIMSTLRKAWNPRPGSSYVAAPNVWTRHEYWVPDPDGERRVYGTDIVINDTEVHPRAAADGFAAAISQGVTDTLVEHVVNGEASRSNTMMRFEATDDDQPWVLVRDAAALDALDLPPDDAARINQSLSSGAAALVGPPQSSGSSAWAEWWRVDPTAGRTLGIGELGWGQDTMTEAEFQSRWAAYVRAWNDAEKIHQLCTRYQHAVEAMRLVTAASQIYAGMSPHPGPIVTVCRGGVTLPGGR